MLALDIQMNSDEDSDSARESAEGSDKREKRLVERLREAIRSRHYSRRTEKTYWYWVRYFIFFHGKRHPTAMGAAEVTAFLSWLATERNVAAATQNQALSALVFLYKRVLNHALGGRIDAVRADKKLNVPVVMTRDEVAAVLSLLAGTAQLVAKLLYGSGLRIMEAVRLRVKDIDGQIKQLAVRSGKGDKDRGPTFPPCSRRCSRTTWPGSGGCTIRSWLKAMARSSCPMRWLGSIPMPPRSGAGRMSSPPDTSPSTRVLVSLAVILLIPASSTKPSREQSAGPV